LLRPDDEVTNAIAYCLAVSAERYKIDVLSSTVESNHHHTTIYDRKGNCPRFIEHFHKLVARCVNKLRKRKENLWAAVEACVTRLLDFESVLDKLAYASANPVKDRLVERAVQWPGLNGYRHLINDKPLRAYRPRVFFKHKSKLPAEITLNFTIPKELGDRDEVIAELRDRVETIERETKIKRNGARVLGVQGVLGQKWSASSQKNGDHEKTNELRPRFAGSREVRKEALVEYVDFLKSYSKARLSWLSGQMCVFPAGTYWMARFTPLVNAQT
jgi:hypothetical protein